MNLTTIIIAKNEEKNIVDAIDSVDFSKKVILVDNGSTDRTIEIAKRAGAQVLSIKTDDFSKQREEGLIHVKTDWILYIDADERITQELKKEIEDVLTDENSMDAYKIVRRNYYYGKHEWLYREKLERLFKKESLKGWHGKIHESPVYTGEIGELKGFLDHYTHQDLTSMLEKTINWSDTEAQIRFNANHPRMKWWRFPRVMIPTFFRYYIRQKGFRVGTVGLVESIFQTYSIFITYAKLWEMQEKKLR